MIQPVRGTIYTLSQITRELDLDDSPALITRFGVIQDSHIYPEEYDRILKICGHTKWKYRYTTHEWVPVFSYADEDDELVKFLNLEPDLNDHDSQYWTVTFVSTVRYQFPYWDYPKW